MGWGWRGIKTYRNDMTEGRSMLIFIDRMRKKVTIG